MSGAGYAILQPLPIGMGGTGTTIGPTLQSTTVAGLPAASANTGLLLRVTDALLPSLGGIIVGGGAVHCVVFSNGTNWIAA